MSLKESGEMHKQWKHLFTMITVDIKHENMIDRKDNIIQK